MVRDLTQSWGLVKGILEENYATTHKLDVFSELRGKGCRWRQAQFLSCEERAVSRDRHISCFSCSRARHVARARVDV
jgi:hypothetical protein